jgi:tRNA threonylcarbamoyladenosine biosynthesis protein TsaB
VTAPHARPPGPFLALDTSTVTASVAVGRGGEVLAEVLAGARLRGVDAVLPAIDAVLRSAGVAPRELAAVVVSGGPGSFTGIRLAAATAKGLVRALGVPLYAYPGLMALAAGVGAGGAPVCGLFDARRGEVYAACYRFPGWTSVETLLAPAVLPLASLLAASRIWAPVYAGEGAWRHRAQIEAAGGVVAPVHLAPVRAAALLWLAEAVPAAGLVPDPGAWEPDYVRAPGVVPPAAAAAG